MARSIETEAPVTDVSDLAPPEGRELVQMLPAEAYTSEDVLAWERRHLFAGAGPAWAGSPTCSSPDGSGPSPSAR